MIRAFARALLLAFALAACPFIGGFAFAQTALQTSSPPKDLSAVAPGASSFQFTIRRDFTDIGLFTNPSTIPPNQAIGAVGSFNFDELTGRHSLSVDGVAAGVWRLYGDANPFSGLAVGPYIQADDTYMLRHGSLSPQNTDTITAGGLVEFGFSDNGVFDQYVRLRGGDIMSSSGANSTNITGEWIPVFKDPFPVGLPSSFGGPLFYLFTPEMELQYDHLNTRALRSNLFLREDDAFRIGPLLSLRFFVNTALLDPGIPEFERLLMKRTTLAVSYHPTMDALTGRTFSNVSTTLTFNFDDAGNFGLSAGYMYGNSEATANKTNQVKIGLAAKF